MASTDIGVSKSLSNGLDMRILGSKSYRNIILTSGTDFVKYAHCLF
jgi:hypothetical protein